MQVPISAHLRLLGWGGHGLSVEIYCYDQLVGEIVTLTTKIDAKVTWCYMTDPEGNIIELQSWAK